MKRPLLILLPIAVFFMAFSVTAWRMLPRETTALTLAPRETEQQKMQRMLDAARRHMLIADQNPFVGEVKNIQFLRSQFAFYDAAQEGDILIMTTAQAILYSPRYDRITYALSRREAYGERVPPGIRQLSTSASSSPAMCPCTAQTGSAPWMLQSVGSQPAARSSARSSLRSSAQSSRRSSAASSRRSSVPGGWNIVP